MKSDNNIVSWGASGFAGIFTAIQVDDVLKWISLGLTIVSVLISISYNLYKWWQRAKADGKITKEEIKEGIDIVNTGTDNFKDKLQKKG